ncbi:MAG: branched-chain amino acid ABC transporter permease [Ktedonobacterales bacterium]
MTYFLQLLFAGVALGCIYALIGLGFSVIFKASGVINFAQGELLLVGAYLLSAGMFEWHLPFVISLLLAIGCTVVIGVLFERLVLQRMIGKPVFSILMITIGLDVLLRTGVQVRFGSDIQPAGSPFALTEGIDAGELHFGAADLWTIITTVVLCGALYIFLRFTKYGLAMRATALDQEAALALGINIRAVNALAWGIAGLVATIAGAFLAVKKIEFDITLGNAALLAFPAIILGGLDSVPGAVVGGILIGLAEVVIGGYDSHFPQIFGSGIHEITPYLIMIAVLLIRPYGLFGTRKVERI